MTKYCDCEKKWILDSYGFTGFQPRQYEKVALDMQYVCLCVWMYGWKDVALVSA